mgnify:CR=1 FL=1
MAFNTQKFVRVSAGQFDNSQVAANFNYNGNAAGDTKATILASDYFLDQYANLSKGSMISFTATDATLVLAMVTQSLSTGVTIEEITATLPPSSVDTADIKDSAVTSAKIAAAAVTSAKLASAAVTSAKLAADSVLSASIKDANVTAAKLSADSVTAAALKDGEITADKMASGVLPIHNSITNTAGGGTQEDITVSGVLATDVCQVTINTDGSSSGTTIKEARTEAGKVKVVFSADPTSSTKLNISVFRP